MQDAPRIYRYQPPLTNKRKQAISATVGGAGLLSFVSIGAALVGTVAALPAVAVAAGAVGLAGLTTHAIRGGFERFREPREYRDALAALAKGDRAAALTLADAAIARVPGAFSPWTLRGLLLSESGEFEASLTAYREAIARRPESWIGHSGAGAALLNLGKLPEAVEALGKSLALGARFAVPRYQLGLALFLRGEWAGAAEAFGEALALGLEAPNIEFVALTLRAHALTRTGSHEAAKEESARASALKTSAAVTSFASRLKGANLSPVGKLAAWAVGVDASAEPPRLA